VVLFWNLQKTLTRFLTNKSYIILKVFFNRDCKNNNNYLLIVTHFASTVHIYYIHPPIFQTALSSTALSGCWSLSQSLRPQVVHHRAHSLTHTHTHAHAHTHTHTHSLIHTRMHVCNMFVYIYCMQNRKSVWKLSCVVQHLCWLYCEGWVAHLLSNLSLQLGDKSQLPTPINFSSAHPSTPPTFLTQLCFQTSLCTCVSQHRVSCPVVCVTV